MKNLPRIVKITAVKPHIITAIWNNGEERTIDFAPLFQKWEADKNEQFIKLKSYDVFRQVTISGEHTLCWENVPVKIKLKNKVISAPLDLDPDVLYKKSKLIRKITSPALGALLKKARVDAGLSQTDVAINSGTSRNYISRIENNRSDIQLETLFKIVKLGMGKELELIIH